MAARQSNFISRSFVLSDPDVYMKIFQTYVIPILTNCSPVLSPHLKKDRNLIQSACNRFRRGVAYKRKMDRGRLPRMHAELVLAEFDRKMHASILKNRTFRDILFDVVITKTRSACTYRPNLWRRMTRSTTSFRGE